MVTNVTFTNLNNNDSEHEIIFISFTYYAAGFSRITVNFDGVLYKAMVHSDPDGKLYFRHFGKDYFFTFAMAD